MSIKKCKECEFFVENKRITSRIRNMVGRAFRCDKYSMGITVKRETDVEELTCIKRETTGLKGKIYIGEVE